MSATAPRTRNAMPVNAVLVALLDGPATFKTISERVGQEINSVYMTRIMEKTTGKAPAIVVKGAQRHNVTEDGKAGRGRPMNVYALTSAGRSKAKRIAKALATV